jgi:hypothetical protein
MGLLGVSEAFGYLSPRGRLLTMVVQTGSLEALFVGQRSSESVSATEFEGSIVPGCAGV